MTLGNSSLSVDFGDNSSISAPLSGGGLASLPDDSGNNSDVQIFYNNYGMSCTLHADISHIYTSEGNFNVSVSVVTSSASAGNWTLLMVRSVIESVSLMVVNSLFDLRRNVTVNASVSPASLFVNYHWTVSSFDFMDETNSSVVLSSVTDVPRLTLMVDHAGDYLVNVTAVNDVSRSHDAAVITAAVPISSLSLLCDNNEYLPVDAVFDCIAVVKGGSSVEFTWDIGVGNSLRTTTGNSSSVVTVAYPTVGRHNITVMAWNHLSTETAHKTIDIIDDTFELAVFAMEPVVLVGKPVSIMACCVRGSNLTVEFDFGGGHHQLALDAESTVVTASHVYHRPGVKRVTVTAASDVSVITVTVLEHVPAVHLTLVTPPVAGRHLVFMATFNGNSFLHFDFV